MKEYNSISTYSSCPYLEDSYEECPFMVNDSVGHSKFGFGTIVRVRLDDFLYNKYQTKDYLIDIDFDLFGEKTLSYGFCCEGDTLRYNSKQMSNKRKAS